MTMQPPIDAVYTWVDDQWPGYLEQLHATAKTKHDSNRNRTRDNLDVLKYSLRSLARHMPWIRNVYILSMRPQVPDWLNTDHPRIRMVHHDQIMAERHLPTFNSFAILSHQHLLPDLAERFVYLADDFLMGQDIAPSDLIGAGDIDPIYLEHRYAPAPGKQDSDSISPWDAGRAYTNDLMDKAFGANRRRDPGHLACGVRKSLWSEMMELWPEPVEYLRNSPFRAKYNVVPEFLYPHFALHAGRGQIVPDDIYKRDVSYVAINNWAAKAHLDTWLLRRKMPKFYALNDDFGDAANPKVVDIWRRALNRLLPDPSPFEKT